MMICLGKNSDFSIYIMKSGFGLVQIVTLDKWREYFRGHYGILKCNLNAIDLSKTTYLQCILWKEITEHAFVQAVLLMPNFEQRLSFRMFYFMKNDHKIIVKCR